MARSQTSPETSKSAPNTSNQRLLRVVALCVAAVLLIGAAVFLYMNSRETVNEAVLAGKIEMFGGYIESVDHNADTFVLDIDPLGEHKRYTITLNRSTQFFVYYPPKSIVPEEELITRTPGDRQEMPLSEPRTETASRDVLQAGANADVYFGAFLYVDSASRLVADKVVIVKNK